MNKSFLNRIYPSYVPPCTDGRINISRREQQDKYENRTDDDGEWLEPGSPAAYRI